jgi:hypothetical protein
MPFNNTWAEPQTAASAPDGFFKSASVELIEISRHRLLSF